VSKEWTRRLVALVVIAASVPFALPPAIAAVNGLSTGSIDPTPARVSLKMLGSIGSFTPVTHDERLARSYAAAARQSLSRNFRFTPTSGSTSGAERSLTVMVRAATDGSNATRRAPANIGIAPVSYSLRGTRGLTRLAGESVLPGREPDPMALVTAEKPTASFVLQAKPKRFSTDLQLESRAQTTAAAQPGSAPTTLSGEKSYAVDLSSSYALSRNLKVQAGVRYKGPDNRLVPIEDQQQDSQAVYVGTTFKF
jgi:hypothetical protein